MPQGIALLSQCLSCPAGYYCLSYNLFTPTGLCPSGYYCPSGSISGILCPPGAFCSIGAPEYSSCPSGTYQNNPGQSFCLTCPAGFFCPGGVIDYNSGAFDCPPGYYCLNGTRYSTEYPCPSGTFSNRSNALSLNDCTLAPGGYFVNGTGNFEVTGMCDSGYYCPLGALTATPHCNTTYCTSGGRCVPGQFCPNASAIFSPCPGGFYCGGYNGEITGPCSAGYYCTQGSYTSTPVKLVDSNNISIGDICPTGYYCTVGSSKPSACPLGSFSVAGSTSKADCHACPAGYYCTSPSLQVEDKVPVIKC